MKVARIVITIAFLLMAVTPAMASRRDGKWGCFTCEVRYSPSQLYTEKCNQVLSGQYGNATFCYTMTMDTSTFCQMEGGACYYIVVEGTKAPEPQMKTSDPAGPEARPVHIF